MSESTSDAGWGCLSAVGGVILIGVLISFLQWLWGIVVAVAIWLWLAPGRLVAWILSWPLFTGHLLLGLLTAAAMGAGLIQSLSQGPLLDLGACVDVEGIASSLCSKAFPPLLISI